MPGFRRIVERLRAVRHIEWALLLALAAALFLLMSGAQTSSRESSALERRMESVLECIQGAGRVRVLVNSPDSPAFSTASVPVTGVLVVAEGADNMLVSLELRRAVQTLLGLEAGQIEILDMKEDEP